MSIIYKINYSPVNMLNLIETADFVNINTSFSRNKIREDKFFTVCEECVNFASSEEYGLHQTLVKDISNAEDSLHDPQCLLCHALGEG